MKRSSRLNAQLNSLINLVLDQKKFEFSSDEITFEHNLLIQKSVITLTEQTWKINPSLISHGALDAFCERLGYKWGNDVKEFYEFIKGVSDFFGGNMLLGRTRFQDSIRLNAIHRFTENGGDLLQYARYLKEKGDKLYALASNIADSLVELPIAPGGIIELVNFLAEQINVSEPGIADGNTMVMAKGIRHLAKVKPDVGEYLVKHCIESPKPTLITYHVAILAGLLDADVKYLNIAIKFLNIASTQHLALTAFAVSQLKHHTFVKKYIDAVEQQVNTSEIFERSLPHFYCSILKKVGNPKSTLTKRCFNKLKLLSVGPTGPLVISELRYTEGFDEQIGSVISSYIRQDGFDLVQCKGLADIFYNLKNVKYYFDTICFLALRFKTAFPTGDFSSMGSIIRQRDPENFEKHILEMLADDYGEIRFVAIRLLAVIDIGARKRKFVYDITQLPAVIQYRICLSVCQGFRQLELIVPIIGPLLRSPFELVRDLTSHRLSILTESYGAAVLELVKNQLVELVEQDQVYLEQIELHLKEYNVQCDQKRDIKELDPRYTQNQYLKQFFTSQSRSMQESLDKNRDPNSLSSMLKTVILGKGGGFRMTNEGKVSKLGLISTSMTIPREYSVAPELFDFEEGRRIGENWKGGFDEWEAMISL